MSRAILSWGCDGHHWLSSSADFKNEWKNTSTSPVCLYGVNGENFPSLFVFFTNFYETFFSSRTISNILSLATQAFAYSVFIKLYCIQCVYQTVSQDEFG